MCYTPLTLRNPRLNPVKGIDPQELIVSCGHCPQCRETRTNDWFVRSYFEWLETKKYNGYTQSITLTYDSHNLPFVMCRCNDGSQRSFPCFCRRHFQLLMKQVNKYLRSVGVRYSYVISSEYGDEKHRPHYHLLINVKSDVILPSKLVDLVRKYWRYGHIYTTDINNGVITDVRGIRYASKYAVKDIYQDKWYNKQLSRIVKFEKDGSFTADYLEFIQNRPFHQVSQGYGLYALTPSADGYVCGSLSTLMSGYVYVPDYSNVVRKYRLPLYLERKLFYNSATHVIGISKDGKKRYSTSYCLNDLGLKMQNVRLLTAVDAFKVRVSRVFSYPFTLSELNNVYSCFVKSYPKSDIGDLDVIAFLRSITNNNIDSFVTSMVLFSKLRRKYVEVINLENGNSNLSCSDVQHYVDNYVSLKYFNRDKDTLDSYSSYDGVSFRDLIKERDFYVDKFPISYYYISYLLDELYKIISDKEVHETERKEAIAVRLKILKRKMRNNN